MGKTCFFIGHREAGEEIFPALVQSVERHIMEYGVTDFLMGERGNFDHLAARAVRLAKQTHPEIRLVLLLAYHPAERPVTLPRGFDTSYYPSGMETVPRRVAIVQANRRAVDWADFLIAYAWHPASNARNLVEYAQSRIPVENLAESMAEIDI